MPSNLHFQQMHFLLYLYNLWDFYGLICNSKVNPSVNQLNPFNPGLVPPDFVI
jgi:hypothetical protein